MIKLSQRDPRWAGKTIGKSQSLMKDYGCTITSVSMASDYFGCYKDPAWLAKNLLFNNDLLLWQSINKVLCFRFSYRYYRLNLTVFANALKDPKTVLLLNVYNRHWVIATKRLIGSYMVVDPWTGTTKVYSDSSISGGTVLIK